MKFTFTRKRNEDEDYSSFNGDDSYYNFGENADDAISDDEDGFGMSGFDAEADDLAQGASPFASSTASVALKIVNPKGYDEAPAIADFLLNGNTVLLNIEGLERMDALRLLDYLSGATRMVGGMMTKVGKTTIVVAPKSVDVSSIEAMVGEN